MRHVATEVDGLQVCLVCHLLMPCHDGAILNPPFTTTWNTSVDQIREALSTGDTRVLLPMSQRRRLRAIQDAAAKP